MTRQFLKDAFGWGFLLWLIGYILGFIFFPLVPNYLLGWMIMPIGIAITLWVLFKKVQSNSFIYYVWIALVWVAIAIIFDYLFLVLLLHPADGYYKLDVYIYYFITFLFPLLVGRKKLTGN